MKREIVAYVTAIQDIIGNSDDATQEIFQDLVTFIGKLENEDRVITETIEKWYDRCKDLERENKLLRLKLEGLTTAIELLNEAEKGDIYAR